MNLTPEDEACLDRMDWNEVLGYLSRKHGLYLPIAWDTEVSRENARVDVIEELIQDFEDRLTYESKNMVMERYADLYNMTYDELMAEKEKMDAEKAKAPPNDGAFVQKMLF